MTSNYDYLLNKFKKVLHFIDYKNFSITHCNLMFIIKKKFYLENINNICKIQENFIDNIDFYNIQFYNNMTVDNHILLYFLNKQSQTNIIIKIINNGIFDISASNRNKQNINYVDIVSILYKLFEINCINSELIENISINLIQIYYNLFIDFNIMNKILNNKFIKKIDDKFIKKIDDIFIKKIDDKIDDKIDNKKNMNNILITLKKCNIYIFKTGILLTSSNYNDIIIAYDYISLVISEYIFAINNNKTININDFLMEIAL